MQQSFLVSGIGILAVSGCCALFGKIVNERGFGVENRTVKLLGFKKSWRMESCFNSNDF